MPSVTARELAAKQREISVAEFFERNKHMLGFDSPTRALITSIKEGLDNAMDACEEARIQPELLVSITPATNRDEFVLVLEDNGPGIVKEQIPNIFARLLYGSRFHAIRQSRGQQGIGISAAVMYGQLTTGKAATIYSVTEDGRGHKYGLKLDTSNNRPDIVSHEVVHFYPDRLLSGLDETSAVKKQHGTRIEINLIGRYQRGKQSVLEYIRNSSIINPHARIVFQEPDGAVHDFVAVTNILPAPTAEIKPHPYGVSVGQLLKMAGNSEEKTVKKFLMTQFSCVTTRVANKLCKDAEVNPGVPPDSMDENDARRLVDTIQVTKMMDPPTDCLAPIGDELIRKGLRKEIDARFASTITRNPKVQNGHPFVVEAGLVYGKDEGNAGSSVTILRFANRVPLMYQQGGCAVTKAIEEVDWRKYGLEQRAGKGVPHGPVTLLVHICSTNVPFTSEAKEAVSDIDEVRAEIKRALQDCGRKLKSHINKNKKLGKLREKYELIQTILPELARKSAAMLDEPVPALEPVITRIMNVLVVDHKLNRSKETAELVLTMTNYTEHVQTCRIFIRSRDEPSSSTESFELHYRLIGFDVEELGPGKTWQTEMVFHNDTDLDDAEIFHLGTKGETLGSYAIKKDEIKSRDYVDPNALTASDGGEEE